MAMLTDEMKQIIADQRPGYIATASKEGIPNVSPKGSTRVIDDETIAFAAIMSEKTIRNLEENPNIAVAVLDVKARKGYQFRGTATLEGSGGLFDELSAAMKQANLPDPKFAVRIKVSQVFDIPPKR